MGKTFRKNSGHNKFNKRDRDAKEKFSRKFQNPKRGKISKLIVDETDVDDYDNN